MNILGIETSCDETACSIVEDGVKIISSTIATSSSVHVATGGIIPENAARLQVEYIIPVISKALNEAFPNETDPNIQISEIDAIAVTYGPGLVGSLLVGVETAKTLSYLWNKPIIPVNHLVAHIYANFVHKDTSNKSQDPNKINGSRGAFDAFDALDTPQFPAVALVVSGGHTDFVLMNNHGEIEWIGGTRDDAAGECFDKCARLLDLPYPGGPSISSEAAKFDLPNSKFQFNLFPRPMINSKDLDFSFSGLKTAVYNFLQNEHKNISRAQIAAEVQEAIVDVLVKKSIDAIEKYKPKSFLFSGGVAANKRLSEKLIMEFRDRKLEIGLHIPPPNLCTDNAAVIASCGFYNYNAVPWKDIEVNPQLEISS